MPNHPEHLTEAIATTVKSLRLRAENKLRIAETLKKEAADFTATADYLEGKTTGQRAFVATGTPLGLLHDYSTIEKIEVTFGTGKGLPGARRTMWAGADLARKQHWSLNDWVDQALLQQQLTKSDMYPDTLKVLVTIAAKP